MMRMDKVLAAWLKQNPEGTINEFSAYWKSLNECLDVRSE